MNIQSLWKQYYLYIFSRKKYRVIMWGISFKAWEFVYISVKHVLENQARAFPIASGNNVHQKIKLF